MMYTVESMKIDSNEWYIETRHVHLVNAEWMADVVSKREPGTLVRILTDTAVVGVYYNGQKLQ